MTWGFFKRKKQYQLPLPQADKQSLEVEKYPQSGPDPRIERTIYQESSSQQSNDESLFDLVTKSTSITLEGDTYKISGQSLVGIPSRNFVMAHTLQPLVASKLSDNENYRYLFGGFDFPEGIYILPLGILYFPESHHLDSMEIYSIQHAIAGTLEGITKGLLRAVYRSPGKKGGRLFLRKTRHLLEDLASHIQGAEVRIYEFIEDED